MNEADVAQIVREEILRLAPECETEGLRTTTRLREDLDLDLFDFLRLITALHQRLGVDIPESDYRQLSTLGDCVSYLRKAVTKSASTMGAPSH